MLKLLSRVVVTAFVVLFGGAGQAETQSARGYNAKELLENARFFEAKWQRLKSKRNAPIDYVDLESVIAGINAIPDDAAEKAEALAIRDRLEREREAIKRASTTFHSKAVAESNLSYRKTYAARAEKEMLDKGRDYYFRVEGKEARTLRIRFILMSRPLVHQMTSDREMVAEWRGLGFHEVVFTDGRDNTWRLKLR